jgi:hypothetical protein
MEKDWVKIRTYTDVVESELTKQMLIEHEINAIILNKQDSSYFFGRLELYVQGDQVERAEELINSET